MTARRDSNGKFISEYIPPTDPESAYQRARFDVTEAEQGLIIKLRALREAKAADSAARDNYAAASTAKHNAEDNFYAARSAFAKAQSNFLDEKTETTSSPSSHYDHYDRCDVTDHTSSMPDPAFPRSIGSAWLES